MRALHAAGDCPTGLLRVEAKVWMSPKGMVDACGKGEGNRRVYVVVEWQLSYSAVGPKTSIMVYVRAGF